MHAAHALRNVPGHEPVGGLVGQRGNGRIQKRNRNICALACALPLEQRQEQPFLELVRGQQVNERNGHFYRLAAGFAAHEQETGFGLQHHIEGGQGIVVAEARDLAEDEPGIALAQGVVVHAQFPGGILPEVADDDIGLANGGQHLLAISGVAEVAHPYGFAPIDGSVISGGGGIGVFGRQFPGAGHVAAGLFVFHLDDLSAQLRKEHAYRRPGQYGGQFYYFGIDE